jgi:hypothetical protein
VTRRIDVGGRWRRTHGWHGSVVLTGRLRPAILDKYGSSRTTGRVGEVDSRQVPRGRVAVWAWVVAVWATTALGLAGCRVGIIINNWPIRMALRLDEGLPVEQGMVCVVEARDA